MLLVFFLIRVYQKEDLLPSSYLASSVRNLKRKALVTTIILAIAAITFGIFEVLAGGAYVPQDYCRIGTFNLQITHKGGIGSQNLDDRFNKIANLIALEDLQVVALQEVNAGRMEQLIKDLDSINSHCWKYLLLSSGQVAVLFQADRVSVEGYDRLSLNGSQGELQERDALFANVRVLPDGFDFVLVVVHLAEGKQQQRQEQLKSLHRWAISQLEKGDEQDIIIAGDFNTPFLMNQQSFEILDGGIGFYIVQQDAGKDLYSDFTDKTYGNPVDFLIISPDCRAEYVDNTSSFGSYNTEGEKDSVSDHRLAWASFSSNDLDNPARTPLVVSNDAISLDMPVTVQRGGEITVTATTFLGAKCTIRVLYPSGALAQAISAPISETSGDKEKYTWKWKTSGSTNPGVATVQVQASWKWGHALSTGTFEITSKAETSASSDDNTEG